MSWGDTQYEYERRGTSGDISWRLSSSWLVRRIALTYAGIILPIICFALTWNGPIDPPVWQSGSWNDYAHLMLWGRATVYFFPLLIYSMICFGLIVYRVKRAVDSFFVRAGVYTGVLLALHYVFLFSAAPDKRSGLIGSIVGFGMFLGLAAVIAILGVGGVSLIVGMAPWKLRAKRSQLTWSVVVMLLLIVIGAAINDPTGELSSTVIALPLLPLAATLLVAPFLTLFAFAFVAAALLQLHWPRGQFRLGQMLFAIGWLGYYLGACRQAVQVALAEYAKLPTEPPSGCYVATAAARGHPKFVGAKQIAASSGGKMLVNRQLQVLKAGELAIRAVCPRLHRAMRLVYDIAGPRLASCLRHPLLADAAYLSLKPAEWATRVALACLDVRIP